MSLQFSMLYMAITSLLLSTSLHAGGITTKLTDQTDSALDSAVVFAMALQADGAEMKKSCEALKCPQLSVAQKNLDFDPEVTLVQTGTKITFPNLDRVKHQVYSVSATKKFELPLYSGEPQKPETAPAVVFDKSGEVVLGCNIHDTMKAYIYVMDTPYFTQGKNGEYALKGLPPGKYVVKVWHPLAAVKDALPTRKVDLATDASAEEWSAKLSLRKTKPKVKAPEGVSY